MCECEQLSDMCASALVYFFFILVFVFVVGINVTSHKRKLDRRQTTAHKCNIWRNQLSDVYVSKSSLVKCEL